MKAPRRRQTYNTTESDAVSHLSSEDVWHVLNDLLRMALNELFRFTPYNEDCLCSLICSSLDKRRKVSILDAVDCQGVLFYSLVFERPEDQLNTLLNISVEKNLLAFPAQRAVSADVLPEAVTGNSPIEPGALLRNVKFAFEYYEDLRQRVAQRYLKLAEFSAKKNAWGKSESGLLSEHHEHYNNHMMAVMRAIDKFYPHSGTLTSYVQTWMNNASGSSYVTYIGEAYTVPKNRRKVYTEEGSEAVSNFSKTLDSAVELADEADVALSDDDLYELRELYEDIFNIPLFKPALLDEQFPNFLTAEDIDYLRKHSVKLPDNIRHHGITNRMAAVLKEFLGTKI